MLKNLKNLIKSLRLDFFCLIFSMSQLGLSLTKENNEIILIYNINIDWMHTVITLIIALIIVLSLLLLVAYAILLERKVLGSIQKRRGPNLVGIFGLLQPIADAVKLIVKETIIPVSSNRIVFIIAPLLTLILSLLNWSIIPFSSFAILANIRVSILMFFAISSLTVYGIIMSGWSSNSKYAFLGALRAAAQIIAYEVSIGLTLIYILLQSNDLNYLKIIYSQMDIWNGVPCFIFFILFFISTLAETNRPPFDLPEAEAELVSGYNVEYSAMAFGFFFLGEYVSIWTVCCLNIILFWGGYLIIFNYESIFIYSLKVIILVISFIWIRGSLPRYRYDQLMRLGWKILLPISLGFVILYSGLFYYFLYLANTDRLLELLRENEKILEYECERLYNLYNFFIDLNIWKQFKINLEFKTMNDYQNVIIKTWQKLKNLIEIFDDLEIIKRIEKSYLDIRNSDIFKKKKYIKKIFLLDLDLNYNLKKITKKILNGVKYNIDIFVNNFSLTYFYNCINKYSYFDMYKYSNIISAYDEILWYYHSDLFFEMYESGQRRYELLEYICESYLEMLKLQDEKQLTEEELEILDLLNKTFEDITKLTEEEHEILEAIVATSNIWTYENLIFYFDNLKKL